MFLVVADNATLASHRLGQCLSTLEKVQVRIMTDVLEQKDVLGPQESQMQIRALREQIATMEGGLAKIISGQNDHQAFRDKVKQAISDGWSREGLLGLFEEPAS